MAQTRKAYLRMKIILERRFNEQGCDDWFKEAVIGFFALAMFLLLVALAALK